MTRKINEIKPVARLEVVNGILGGRVFQFEGEVVIGRKDENTSLTISPDILLPDNRVSRRHARIFIKDGHFFIEDLISTNGTFLNGSNVAKREPVMMFNGSNVQVGETLMRFCPVIREEMLNGEKRTSFPWESEIGLNEQVFDLSESDGSDEKK